MAKMAKVKNEDAEGIQVSEGKKDEAPIAPKLGQIVHYHKSIQTNNGAKIKSFAAIINGFPDGASNFQPQDRAVNLTIFIDHGGVVESKQGIMFSPIIAHNRWTIAG